MRIPRQLFAGERSEDLARFLKGAWEELARIVNGNLRFGEPSIGPDNIDGAWYSATTPGVADTEFTVTHNLNRVPVGFILFSIDKAGVVYRSATSWTTTQAFLKCNVTSAAVILFIH